MIQRFMLFVLLATTGPGCLGSHLASRTVPDDSSAGYYPPAPPIGETQAAPEPQTPASPGEDELVEAPPGEPVLYYYGGHPIPPEYGGGWCDFEGPHAHPFSPVWPEQYVVRDGYYYFGADIDYAYLSGHPIPSAFGGGWCNIPGSHAHRYWPSHDFEYDGGRRVYVYRREPARRQVSSIARPRRVVVSTPRGRTVVPASPPQQPAPPPQHYVPPSRAETHPQPSYAQPAYAQPVARPPSIPIPPAAPPAFRPAPVPAPVAPAPPAFHQIVAPPPRPMPAPIAPAHQAPAPAPARVSAPAAPAVKPVPAAQPVPAKRKPVVVAPK